MKKHFFRTELIVKQNNQELPQAGISHNRISQTLCSWEAVEKSIGLKLCSSYSLVNITQEENVPYVILSGPTAFRFYIHKADPSANVYFFEYKWTPTLTTAHFDTPGSKVKRLFSANLTTIEGVQNLMISFQSSEGTMQLKGKLVNRPDQRLLRFTMDINHIEHFDVMASLSRIHMKNGFVYKPTMYISINKDRIFNFKGKYYIDRS